MVRCGIVAIVMVVVSVRVAEVRSSVLSGCCHSGIVFVVVGDRCGSIIVEVMVVVHGGCHRGRCHGLSGRGRCSGGHWDGDCHHG